MLLTSTHWAHAQGSSPDRNGKTRPVPPISKVQHLSHYKSNVRDIEFNLFEVFGRDEVLGKGPFEEVDADTAKTILSEVDRLAREDLAASFEDGDRNPPVYDPETCSVKMPESFTKSYQAFMD